MIGLVIAASLFIVFSVIAFRYDKYINLLKDISDDIFNSRDTLTDKELESVLQAIRESDKIVLDISKTINKINILGEKNFLNTISYKYKK